MPASQPRPRPMKHFFAALLFATVSSSALADTPAKIAEDYRKASAAAVAKLNETLEQSTTPLIAKLISSGDTDGADALAAQLKAKLAGEPVATPQASAVLLFAQYDQARAKALEPVQRASISRIESLVKSTNGSPRLETLTELSKVRAEIEAGNPAAEAGSTAAAPRSSAAAPSQVADLVKSLGGTCKTGSEGDEVSFSHATLTTADLQQITAGRGLRSFIWNLGKGLTDEGVAAFAGLKNLQTLYLWGAGRITDAGLRHLSGCEKLEVLNIGANSGDFTGAGLEHLSQCKSLRKLNLSYLRRLEGKNLRFLVPLKSFEILLLSDCRGISDADLEVIAQLTQLQSLDLGKTSVTDAGLARLKGLSHLKELFVSAPLVTPEGVKVLTEAFPALVVKFTQ